MKNLKRALSFALASVMLIGMMVVGSSAAVLKDIDDVEHVEAVNSMVALGLINGRGGNYEPEAEITRAEMAKLICVALNGGRDPKLDGECQFTDMKGHWAAGYVQYCVNMGIVSGRSATIFDPQSAITAQEAAKMLLVAIGYNADNESFKGNGWGGRVDVVANQKGLYDDVMLLTTSKLNRDDAAQIVWNAMDATMVTYDWYPVTNNGVTEFKAVAKDDGNKDILSEKFNLDTAYGYMSGVSYDEKKEEYTYNFSNNADIFASAAAIATDDLCSARMTSTQDFSDMFGMKVRVLSKTVSGKTTVYGMYVDEGEVLFEGYGSDITVPTIGATKIELDDTEYNVGDNVEDIPVVGVLKGDENFDLDEIVIGTTGAKHIAKETPVKLIDADGDGKGDMLTVAPYSIAKVTFVGTSSITAGGSYDFEDDHIEDGIEKGDYVKVVDSAYTVYPAGDYVVTKADVVSGNLVGLRGSSLTTVGIDGTYYTQASNVLTSDTLTVGESYDLVVVGKYWFQASMTSEGATLEDVVYVTASETATSLSTANVKVYFMDGTNQIVKVSEVNGDELGNDNKVAAGLYTFTVDGSEYELTSIAATATKFDGLGNTTGAWNTSGAKTPGENLAGFDGVDYQSAGSFTATGTDKLNGLYMDDDAIVIVNSSNGDNGGVKFFTGAQAKKWNSDYTTTRSIALYDEVNGLDTAKVAVLEGAGALPSGGDETYGYITSAPTKVKDGDNTRISYSIWTADGTVSVLEKSTSITVAKGDIIVYDDLGDGYIENVTKLNNTGSAVAVLGFNAKNIDVANGGATSKNSYKLTDDTQYLFVDTSNKKGVDGGELAIAGDSTGNGNYILNAYVVVEGYNRSTGAAGGSEGAEVLLVVFDVGNDLAAYDNTTSGGGITGVI